MGGRQAGGWCCQPETSDLRSRGHHRSCSVAGHTRETPGPRVGVPSSGPGGRRPQDCIGGPEPGSLGSRAPRGPRPTLADPVRPRGASDAREYRSGTRSRRSRRAALTFISKPRCHPGASGGCGRGRGSTTFPEIRRSWGQRPVLTCANFVDKGLFWRK